MAKARAAPTSRAFNILESLNFRIPIDDCQRNGAAQCRFLPNSRQHVDGVGLKFLPSASAVPSLSSLKFAIDESRVNFEAGRKAVDHRQQRFSVRFTRS